MNYLEYTKLSGMTDPIQEYAETLSNSDRLRISAWLLSVANSIQQTVTQEPEGFDSYELHNTLEDICDNLEGIADEL